MSFLNDRGLRLVGIIDWPPSSPRAFSLFAHCFTCTKDLKAIVRISQALAQAGLAVLRFDFTGLGHSQGDFSLTNFSTNCADIHAAAAYLRAEHRGPELLLGHSLGGTAMVTVANQLDSARAVATVASPSSTQRLATWLAESYPEILTDGEALVPIGGRQFPLRRQLLDDLQHQDIEHVMSQLRLPILMFHSPQDRTLPYDWGLRMFERARSPKSFVTLDGADHLLAERPTDIPFVARMIDCWARRYL